MISFNSGDKVDENTSARAEAMAFVWSPLACIGVWKKKGQSLRYMEYQHIRQKIKKWKSNIQQLAHLFMITLLLLILSHSHWYPPFKII
jgi:hypothetical protein